LTALILGALATRAALIFFAPRPFGYVWDLYHEGVLTLYDQGRLPCASDCWECYPPPLYFILGVPFYALGKLLSGGTAAGGLRLLASASMLCAGAAAWFCVKTLDLFRPSKPESLLATALVLVFPCLFIGSFAAESDILLTALMSAFFYRLCLYHLKPGSASFREPLVLGVLAGLSALTKYSGLLALPAAGAVMGLRALRGRRPLRAARDFAIAAAAAAAVCGWHYAGNLRSAGRLFLQPPWLSNASSFRSLPQNLARYDFASFKIGEVVDVFRSERPGVLDGFKVYRSVLSSLYATAWTDMTFFSLPARQPWKLPQGYGEGAVIPMVVRTPASAVRVAAYPEKRISLRLVDLVLRAGLVPGGLALIGLCATLRRRALQPFVIFSTVTLATYTWWLLGQDSWAIKAKYILFLLPAYVVYAMLGLRALSRLDRRVGLAAAWALAAAIVITEAYLLMFALG
jgi:4-amino-4-deoxy-L-arabinose transferase-like glycosyltransferase